MLRSSDTQQGKEQASEASSDNAHGGNLALAHFLFENVRSEVISYLRRALGGDAAAAEDLAQEAITRIISAQRCYSHERARSLLFSIARNLLVDHFRSERTRVSSMLSLKVIEHDVDTVGPLQTLLWREDLDLVRQSIVGLPPRCRQVFVLSRFEGMSYSAIARHCGISVSMVEKHLSKALRILSCAVAATPTQAEADAGDYCDD